MLTEDLFATDWDALDIHFSNDRRLDEGALVKLSHMRYVKRLTLCQDAPATTFYTPGLFRNIHLNKLYVQHLIIQSVNFNKTKALLNVMRRAHVSILEIVFDDLSVEAQGVSGMLASKIVQPSHIIFTNVRQRDAPKIKWLLEKTDGELSAIWLQKVHKEVTKLTLSRHIDNLHVCLGFPFTILDSIRIKNLYIHANNLSDILKFEESHLGPIAVAGSATTHVSKSSSYYSATDPAPRKLSSTNNVVVESAMPSTSYLVKVGGRDVYDLHVTRDTYYAHKPMIRNKSVIQHQKMPSNWAALYLSAP